MKIIRPVRGINFFLPDREFTFLLPLITTIIIIATTHNHLQPSASTYSALIQEETQSIAFLCAISSNFLSFWSLRMSLLGSVNVRLCTFFFCGWHFVHLFLSISSLYRLYFAILQNFKKLLENLVKYSYMFQYNYIWINNTDIITVSKS